MFLSCPSSTVCPLAGQGRASAPQEGPPGGPREKRRGGSRVGTNCASLCPPRCGRRRDRWRGPRPDPVWLTAALPSLTLPAPSLPRLCPCLLSELIERSLSWAALSRSDRQWQGGAGPGLLATPPAPPHAARGQAAYGRPRLSCQRKDSPTLGGQTLLPKNGAGERDKAVPVQSAVTFL